MRRCPAQRFDDLLCGTAFGEVLGRAAQPERRERGEGDAFSDELGHGHGKKDSESSRVRARTLRSERFQKRNQIRLQARLRGHTLVGERRYVYGPDELRPIEFGRQALHAYRLEFAHPVSGEALRFESPMPADLTALITRLRRSA